MAITTRALAFASRWFDHATVTRVFEPLIADWQREWRDAPPPRRVWVLVRGLAAFVCAVGVSSPRIIATPTPRSITLPVARRIAVFCLVVAGALCIPMVRSLEARSMEVLGLPMLILLALPAALTAAFPFAMVIAVDAIRRDAGVPPHVERAAALKLGAIAVLFMLLAGGVGVPSANHMWRERSTPAGWNIPEPPLSELSTVALLTHPERGGEIVPVQYTRAGVIRRELISRTVNAVLPLLLIWVRWRSLNGHRRFRFWPLPHGWMTALAVVGFFVASRLGFFVEHQLEMAPGSGLWLSLLVFVVWGLTERDPDARKAGDVQEQTS